jgi:hypothetical protein
MFESDMSLLEHPEKEATRENIVWNKVFGILTCLGAF